MSLLINDSVEIQTVSADDLTNVPFDKEIQDKIARMNKGDGIWIEDLKVCGDEGTVRQLMSFIVKIIPEKKGIGQPDSANSRFRNEVRVIVDEMAAQKELKVLEVGWWEALEEVATDSELVELTDHENAIVKNYAFTALTSRKEVDPFPVLLKHLHDTDRILVDQQCIAFWKTTNEYFLLRVDQSSRGPERYKLTPSQQAIVDSMLLFDSTLKFEMKDFLLGYMKPYPQYYSRIREIVLAGQRLDAMLLLAKFKNTNDVAVLKKLFEKSETEYYGVYAAREFPHQSFYPLLKKKFEKEWAGLEPDGYPHGMWEVLYEALAKYPSKETYQLFEKVVHLKDKYQYQHLGKCVLVAIHKNPHPIFEPLKKKIKLDDSHQSDLKRDIKNESW